MNFRTPISNHDLQVMLLEAISTSSELGAEIAGDHLSVTESYESELQQELRQVSDCCEELIHAITDVWETRRKSEEEQEFGEVEEDSAPIRISGSVG